MKYVLASVLVTGFAMSTVAYGFGNGKGKSDFAPGQIRAQANCLDKTQPNTVKPFNENRKKTASSVTNCDHFFTNSGIIGKNAPKK